MTLLLRAFRWIVSGLIKTLIALGVGFELVAGLLVPLQKLLTSKIEERHG